MKKVILSLMGISVVVFASASAFGQEATGACCVANGGCQVITPAECSALSGNYQGDGSVCTPNPCDCCGTDGTEMRGNVDMDGRLNILDVVSLATVRFPAFIHKCPAEADVNGSGNINVVDLTYLVNFLFKNGPPPAMCP